MPSVTPKLDERDVESLSRLPAQGDSLAALYLGRLSFLSLQGQTMKRTFLCWSLNMTTVKVDITPKYHQREILKLSLFGILATRDRAALPPLEFAMKAGYKNRRKSANGCPSWAREALQSPVRAVGVSMDMRIWIYSWIYPWILRIWILDFFMNNIHEYIRSLKISWIWIQIFMQYPWIFMNIIMCSRNNNILLLNRIFMNKLSKSDRNSTKSNDDLI